MQRSTRSGGPVAFAAVVSLFQFDHVDLRRGDRQVLADFSMTVPDGGVTVLSGASGSGKSTVLRLCNRLLVPDAGTISFDGENLDTFDPCALRRRAGMVFQRPTPFAGSVLDNLRTGATVDRERAVALLDEVALDGDFCDRDASELSGGELQRMCLARTLATDPEVLLVDEGTSALDARATATLERLITSLAHKGMSVLWVTHDRAQADRLADHRLSMEELVQGGDRGLGQ